MELLMLNKNEAIIESEIAQAVDKLATAIDAYDENSQQFEQNFSRLFEVYFNKYRNNENVLRVLENYFDEIRASVSNDNYKAEDFEKIALKYRLISKIYTKLDPNSHHRLIDLGPDHGYAEKYVRPRNIERRKEHELKMKILGTIAAVVAWFTREPEAIAEQNSTAGQVETIKKAPEPTTAKFVIENGKIIASGMIFNTEIGATSEHVAGCLMSGKIPRATTLSSETGENKYKSMYCLPTEFGVDFVLFYNAKETLNKFLDERILNAKTPKEFKEKIESGAKLIISTKKNRPDPNESFGQLERKVAQYPTKYESFSQLERKVTLYPTKYLIRKEDLTYGVLSFTLDDKDLVSGASGSPGSLNGDGNYGFVYEGSFEIGLGGRKLDRNYYLRPDPQGKDIFYLITDKNNSIQNGDIPYLDFLKLALSQAKELHPELWNTSIDDITSIKAGVRIAVPLTNELYMNFKQYGYSTN